MNQKKIVAKSATTFIAFLAINNAAYGNISWSDVHTLSTEGENATQPVIATTKQGTVRAVWKEGDNKLYTSFLPSSQETWVAADMIEENVSDVSSPSLALNNQDVGIFAYWDENNHTLITKFYNGQEWEASKKIDSANNLTSGPIASLDSQSRVSIFFVDDLNNAQVATGIDFSDLTVLGAEGEEKDHLSFAINDKGQAYAAWHNVDHQSVEAAFYNPSENTWTELFSTENFDIVNATTPYVTVDQEGKGFIAWKNLSNNLLQGVLLPNPQEVEIVTGKGWIYDFREPQVGFNNDGTITSVWDWPNHGTIMTSIRLNDGLWLFPTLTAGTFNDTYDYHDFKAVIDPQGRVITTWINTKTNEMLSAVTSKDNTIFSSTGVVNKEPTHFGQYELIFDGKDRVISVWENLDTGTIESATLVGSEVPPPTPIGVEGVQLRNEKGRLYNHITWEPSEGSDYYVIYRDEQRWGYVFADKELVINDFVNKAKETRSYRIYAYDNWNHAGEPARITLGPNQ